MSQLVTVSKYNNLQQRIAAILGNSSSSSPQTGYGQNVRSSVHYPVQADVSKITADQYRDLYIDLVRARVHQIGSSNFNIDDFVSGSSGGVSGANKVELSYINSLESLMSTIEANKLDIDGTQINLELFNPSNNGYTDRRVTSWNNQINHIFRISWPSVSARRHFFNAGGEIRMQASLTNEANGKADDWAGLLQTAGIVRLAATNTRQSATANPRVYTTVTNPDVFNVGNYSLSSGFQLMYRKRSNARSNSGAYSQNSFEVYARNINDAVIEFKLAFNDTAGDNNIDNLIIGTLSTFVQSATPFGSVIIGGQNYSTVQISDPFYSNITSISQGS